MSVQSWVRRIFALILTGVMIFELPARAGAPVENLAVRTLSNRADLISGGDALIQVDLPSGAQSAQVEVNGVDVSGEFALRSNGAFQGLVGGLSLGENVVVAHAAGQAAGLT